MKHLRLFEEMTPVPRWEKISNIARSLGFDLRSDLVGSEFEPILKVYLYGKIRPNQDVSYHNADSQTKNKIDVFFNMLEKNRFLEKSRRGKPTLRLDFLEEAIYDAEKAGYDYFNKLNSRNSDSLEDYYQIGT